MSAPHLPHRYRLFGLAIASDQSIPSLEGVRIDAAGVADVRIARGEVPMPDATALALEIQVGRIDDAIVLAVEEVGRFAIRGADAIVVAAEPGATDAQVHAYLLGSVLGTLLHRRGLLPIHCNAVEVGTGTVLFCGDSGAGKSTLAAFMQQRGHVLLTDDLCPLDVRAGQAPLASSGIPRLKLGAASRRLLDLEGVPSRPVPWSGDKVELQSDRPTLSPRPVLALYHLRETEGGRPPGIHRLRGTAVANAITANIYRRRIADLIGNAPFYMSAVAQIAAAVPVFDVNREWNLDRFMEEAHAIERHMLALAAA